MVRKRFFGIISGTKSPRTKIFALFGSSYMTGPWDNIKIFWVLVAFVDFKKRMILISGAQILWSSWILYLERNTFLAKYRYLECNTFFEDFPKVYVVYPIRVG